MTTKKDTHRTIWITEAEKLALENAIDRLANDYESTARVLENLLAKTEKGKTK